MEIQAPKHMPKHSRYSAAAVVGKRDAGTVQVRKKTYATGVPVAGPLVRLRSLIGRNISSTFSIDMSP